MNNTVCCVVGNTEMQDMVPTLPVSLLQTFIEKLLYDRHSARLGKTGKQEIDHRIDKLTSQRELYM